MPARYAGAYGQIPGAPAQNRMENGALAHKVEPDAHCAPGPDIKPP